LGFACWIIFHLFTSRLRLLTTRLDAFAAQETNDVLVPPQGDEIDTLAHTFDRLAKRISHQIEMLQEQDALRRRLVAQVSHDLRTPLASMQGYLETMKFKKDSLSENDHDEFLRIALFQGKRLGQLLGELFELASLDARESQPQPEPFAIAELISDAVEKYHLKAEAQDETFDLSLSQNTPFAFGDIGITCW
jgi:two-component system OmpR family sensor kinase